MIAQGPAGHNGRVAEWTRTGSRLECAAARGVPPLDLRGTIRACARLSRLLEAEGDTPPRLMLIDRRAPWLCGGTGWFALTGPWSPGEGRSAVRRFRAAPCGRDGPAAARASEHEPHCAATLLVKSRV